MNAKEISDSTLPAVTPADNDLMLIYDTSEGTTGKATIADIAPKVASGSISIGEDKPVSGNDIYNELNSFIKMKKINIPAANFVNGMDLSVFLQLDKGYKFLCWVNISSNGWIMDSPIYMAVPNDGGGYPFTKSPVVGNGIDAFYLEIKAI